MRDFTYDVEAAATVNIKPQAAYDAVQNLCYQMAGRGYMFSEVLTMAEEITNELSAADLIGQMDFFQKEHPAEAHEYQTEFENGTESLFEWLPKDYPRAIAHYFIMLAHEAHAESKKGQT